jgi:flagellar protein FliO/FliZ
MMASMMKGLIVVSGLLASSVLQAEESIPSIAPGMTAAYFIKLAGALALVLAIFFISTWILRKLNRIHPNPQGLNIISGLSVGAKEKLVVVQVGEQQLLLGVTATSINKLHVLDTDISNAPKVDNGSFGKTLKEAFNKSEKKS